MQSSASGRSNWPGLVRGVARQALHAARNPARGSVRLSAERYIAGGRPLRGEDRHEDATGRTRGDRQALIEPLLRLDNQHTGEDWPEAASGALPSSAWIFMIQPRSDGREMQRIRPGAGGEVGGVAQQGRQLPP